ncbi:MAG: monovalent cation/H(+) antiporter subunit G [candidate division KSB1 bacterium]|nr:monovalent cation/H(+) antiporter subunit G [candidate division KSB1 bacterium]
MIREWMAALFLISGSIFMFLSALGTLRFPDLFTRMHAATKASSFGIGLMLTACMVYFSDGWAVGQSLLIIIFIFLTAPVGSHMIGRAAYLLKVPLWEKTVVDELCNKYNLNDKSLAGVEPEFIHQATKEDEFLE